MPRVNWHGTEIQATLIEELPNGNYKMRAQGHASRVSPGTVIEVKQSEIVGLNIGGVTFLGPGVGPGANGQQLPTVAEIADRQAAVVREPIVLTKAATSPMAELQSAENSTSVIPLQPEEKPMTTLVEIKGLGNAVASVRSGLAGIRALAADVQVSAGALHAELTDVKAQIEDARSQIKTEASILGNSPSA